jgi:hypothetical protein
MKPQLNQIENPYNLNQFINSLESNLTFICDTVFRIKNYNKNISKLSNNWWTSELTLKRQNLNRIRRQYQRCQSINRDELKQNYTIIRNQYKKLINESKINSWNKFIESNSRDNPWGIAYAISRQKLKVEKVSELKLNDGTIITETNEIANQLMDTLFPNDSPLDDTDYHKELRNRLGENYEEINDLLFTISEVSLVVNDQNETKAPGIDGFTADIIKRINSINREFLPQIYNKCLTFGTFPKIWKISCIKVLKKPNKSDYTTPKAYRPISLLSVFSKILEKLLINRIIFYLTSKNLLNERQYGFTPQKSTIDAIFNAKNFIEKTFERKGFALLIALDISGAFDNAFWAVILNNLREFKCPKNLYYLTKSYFTDRKAKLWYQNTEIEKSLTKGCPQGSACGPGFWSILYNSLLELQLPNNVVIQGFADDTLLMISGQTVSDIENKANLSLEMIHQWSKKNKLEFNASKTISVLFTKNIKYQKPKIKLNSTNLELSNSMLYLGINLDSKLNWKIQINYLKTKSTQLVMNLSSFAKNKYGLNRKALEVIYKGAVIHILSYGSAVWYKALERGENYRIIERIQRPIALRLCSAYKTVSTQALNIIANLMPIDLRLKQIAAEYHVKKNINSDLVEEYLGNTLDINHILKPIDVKTLPHPALIKEIKISQHFITDYCVYTNGHKNNNSRNLNSHTIAHYFSRSCLQYLRLYNLLI